MASAIQYDGTLTCPVECSDMAQAIEWYREMLGFEVIYRLDDMGWCEVQSPLANVTVGLSEVEQPSPGAGGVTLTFGVLDIDAARADLESKGVRFDGETQTIPDMVKLATFFDGDGNKLMFSQTLAGPLA
jgi:predicted enzyme related to lactoylglutathione lyase